MVISDMNVAIGNAIRSLYQAIMLVNEKSYSCNIIDYNVELRSITQEIHMFDEFCDLLYKNIHPEDRENFDHFTDPNYFPGILEEKVHTSLECRIRHADNKYYWSEIIFCNATEEDSSVGHDYLFLIQDIHDWKTQELTDEAEQRGLISDLKNRYDVLFEENMIDQQTHCYNRKGMKYYSDIVINEAKEQDKFLFVCVADLNGLKYLNDTYGHAAGDEAIAAVSSELLNAAPEGSRIVRTGGDEFLMFSALNKDSKEPDMFNERVDAGLKKYNEEHPNPFEIGASYGWVLLPVKDGMIDLDEYIEMADSKMYEMKTKRDKYRRD